MAEGSYSNSSSMPTTGVLLNLRQAVEGQTGAIKVMICRLCRIAPIELIASDHEGNIIQMHASGIRLQQLDQAFVEGNIYRIEGFTADVVGLTTNVGEISSTPVGEPVLQFDIINERLRLHLDVTDGDTTVVVVVPDEAAEALIGILAATLDIKGFKDEINRKKLFGGITVLLGGDFRQILPVISKERRQDTVQASIDNSPLWHRCQVLTLSQSMRVNELLSDASIGMSKQELNEWVLKVGDGEAPATAIDEFEEETWIEIPKEFIVPPQDKPIEQIIDVIYKDFMENQDNMKYLQERAILIL
ncbi:hypothetical protein V2J09_008792 [Rumex salicifolius]